MVGHKRARSGSSLTLQLCPRDLVAVVCGFLSFPTALVQLVLLVVVLVDPADADAHLLLILRLILSLTIQFTLD